MLLQFELGFWGLLNANRIELLKAMRGFMKSDRAQHTILPLSKCGLMPITRQWVRPEIEISTSEVCPMCDGSGKVAPVVIVPDEIERSLEFIIDSFPKSKISLKTHPFVHSYLKKGIYNKQWEWLFKYKRWIRLESEEDLPMNQYKFIDRFNDEIRLN